MKKDKIDRMMKPLLGGLCLVMALTGCSSSKHAAKTKVAEEAVATAVTGTSATEALKSTLVTDWVTRSAAYDAVTAKVNLTLKLSGKSPVKLGGTLRIRRDQVIQLSVTYLLGIEVGRVEISPSGLIIIDRVNKRYVDVPFAELTSMAHADLNYNTLQALFLNELFLPGQTKVTASDASAFSITVDGDEATLTVKNGRQFDYQFLAAVSGSQLKQSHIGLSGSNYALNWAYSDFRTLQSNPFPGLMQVDFEGSSKPVSLTLELSKLGTDTDWETTTQLSSKYERVDWQVLLAQLMKL
jgi:hypothetical protein